MMPAVISFLSTMLLNPMTYIGHNSLFYDLTKYHYERMTPNARYRDDHLSVYAAYKNIINDHGGNKRDYDSRLIGYLEGKFDINIHTDSFYDEKKEHMPFGDAFHLNDNGDCELLTESTAHRYVTGKGIEDLKGQLAVKLASLSNGMENRSQIFRSRNRTHWLIKDSALNTFVFLSVKDGRIVSRLDHYDMNMRRSSGITCVKASIVIKNSSICCFSYASGCNFIEQDQGGRIRVLFSESILSNPYYWKTSLHLNESPVR